MDKKLEEQIKRLAENLKIPVEHASLILHHFQGENKTLESVRIKLSGESTTTKFSNLRFRMKELIMGLLKKGAEFPDNLDNVIKIVYHSLTIFRLIRDLQVYPISREEAKLLVEMFRLELEKDPISIDSLRLMLGQDWDQDQLITHLNNLERLGCVTYSEAGVKIEEEIIFA